MKEKFLSALKNKTLIRALITAVLLGFGVPQFVPLVPVAAESICQVAGGCGE